MLHGLKLKADRLKRLLSLFVLTLVVNRAKVRALLVRYVHEISDAQVAPITEMDSSGEGRIVCIEGQDLNYFWVRRFLKSLSRVELVMIQSHWDLDKPSRARFDFLFGLFKNSKKLFLDWYAPLHIPEEYFLNNCDLYLKKQTLKDRSLYSKGMHDTNLIEYEAKYGVTIGEVPFLRYAQNTIDNKLRVGWNFASSPRLIRLLSEETVALEDRCIDLHGRFAAPKDSSKWYSNMRNRSLEALRKLDRDHPDCSLLISAKRLSFDEFYSELKMSKLCISPFGFGEVCWRDFEAFAAGSVLLKPSMDHIDTNPAIFIPYETYIPLSWDYSDLDRRFREALDNPDELNRIAQNARAVWEEFINSGFDRKWQEILAELGLSPDFELLRVPAQTC